VGGVVSWLVLAQSFTAISPLPRLHTTHEAHSVGQVYEHNAGLALGCHRDNPGGCRSEMKTQTPSAELKTSPLPQTLQLRFPAIERIQMMPLYVQPHRV
jgi:hypothetical protein